MRTLSVEDISNIHVVLVKDFENSKDPISPPGLKDKGLLESAVARQNTASGTYLKYDEPRLNAATLCYGICCNHPFHNGNKRTALVALLCHLDKNSFRVTSLVTQDELYKLMIDIASHKFSQKDNCADADNEVERLYTWLKRNTEKIEKSERPITYRYLGKILKKFGFELKDRYKGYTGVYRMKDSVRIAHIPCSGDGVQVGREVLRTVREECKLTEAHGCDSRLFYEEGEVINFFINKYRKTLDKLSKV